MRRLAAVVAGLAGCNGPIQGDGPGESRFELAQIALTSPVQAATDLAFLPDGTLLILGKAGRVSHFELQQETAQLLGTFDVPAVYSASDCGLISVAVDPDFSTNHFLYLGYCVDAFGSRIARFTFDPDAPSHTGVPATLAVIFEARHPSAQEPWHNVGAMGFEPNGVLWALFGDKTVSATAQDVGSELGSLVRLIPNREPAGTGATPAPDNPYAGTADASPYVWAKGLRSPWTGFRDRLGRYWIGDVGFGTFEEVNLVTEAGQNFGWPIYEGPCPAAGCSSGRIGPLASYDRTSTQRYAAEDPQVTGEGLRVVWVSPTYEPHDPDPYRGALDGYTFFGDFCLGFVRRLRVDDDGAVVSDDHFMHLEASASWVVGPDGRYYLPVYGSCFANPHPEARLFRLDRVD